MLNNSTGWYSSQCVDHLQLLIIIWMGKYFIAWKFQVWSCEGGTEYVNFTGHADIVRCCCYSPDGSQIVSCSDDTLVKVLWHKMILNPNTYLFNPLTISRNSGQRRLYILGKTYHKSNQWWGFLRMVYNIVNHVQIYKMMWFVICKLVAVGSFRCFECQPLIRALTALESIKFITFYVKISWWWLLLRVLCKVATNVPHSFSIICNICDKLDLCIFFYLIRSGIQHQDKSCLPLREEQLVLWHFAVSNRLHTV